MADENFEREKEERREKERTHDQWDEQRNFHNTQMVSFALAAIRAPAVAAAGGIATSLGFFSANYAILRHTSGAVESFNRALFWFALALVLAIVVPIFGYFAEFFSVRMVDSLGRRSTEPYIYSTESTDSNKKFNKIFSFAGVSFTIAAIGAFIYGMCCFYNILYLMQANSSGENLDFFQSIIERFIPVGWH